MYIGNTWNESIDDPAHFSHSHFAQRTPHTKQHTWSKCTMSKPSNLRHFLTLYLFWAGPDLAVQSPNPPPLPGNPSGLFEAVQRIAHHTAQAPRQDGGPAGAQSNPLWLAESFKIYLIFAFPWVQFVLSVFSSWSVLVTTHHLLHFIACLLSSTALLLSMLSIIRSHHSKHHVILSSLWSVKSAHKEKVSDTARTRVKASCWPPAKSKMRPSTWTEGACLGAAWPSSQIGWS